MRISLYILFISGGFHLRVSSFNKGRVNEWWQKVIKPLPTIGSFPWKRYLTSYRLEIGSLERLSDQAG